MSIDDLFNWAALSQVPDPIDSPTVRDRESAGEKRLYYQKITENPDHLGMLYSMVAAANGLHPEIRVGAVAYDLFTAKFGPPACNHLTQEAQKIGFSPMMLANPLDKRFTECAEIRAIQQTLFLMRDSGENNQRRFYRDRDWVLYSTRLPCKRCREFVAQAHPLEIAVHKQTTDWLLANKPGYKLDLEETTEFFYKRKVRIRQADLPLDFMSRLFAEIAMEMPFGVPNYRRWRTPKRRKQPRIRLNREDE